VGIAKHLPTGFDTAGQLARDERRTDFCTPAMDGHTGDWLMLIVGTIRALSLTALCGQSPTKIW
jgi:hypothetical protein